MCCMDFDLKPQVGNSGHNLNENKVHILENETILFHLKSNKYELIQIVQFTLILYM